MANKFHDNLIVSSSPHIVTESDTTRLMGSVLLALAPAWIASIYIFGLRALLLSVVCVAASVLFEYIYKAITHKKQTVGDLSAALTGLLIAFNVPANFPFWQALIGCLFAIVVVKQLFGGIGKNSAYLPVHLVLGKHVHMACDETRRGYGCCYRPYTSGALR